MNEENEQLLTPRQRLYLEANPDAYLAHSSNAKTLGQPHEVSGVGGWLLLLALSLAFFGPLISFASTYSELTLAQAGRQPSATDNLETTLVWGYCAFNACTSIYAGYRLFRLHKSSTIPIVIGIICLIAGMQVMIAVLAGGTGGSGVAAIRSTIWAFAWTAYLFKSKRVKNTFK